MVPGEGLVIDHYDDSRNGYAIGKDHMGGRWENAGDGSTRTFGTGR